MAYPLDRLASLLVTGKKPAGRRYHGIPQSQTGEPIANLRGAMTNTQLRRGQAVRTRCSSPVRAFHREKIGGGGGGESEAESCGGSASTHADGGSPNHGGDESGSDDDEPDDSHSSMVNLLSRRQSADQELS